MHTGRALALITTTAVALALLASPAFAGTYLALGDSVAYGLDPTKLSDPSITQASFTGYPETVAAIEQKKEVNAACPGETSGSFINGGPDYGCNSPRAPFPLPFRASGLMHTAYAGTQLQFAVSELKSNKQV